MGERSDSHNNNIIIYSYRSIYLWLGPRVDGRGQPIGVGGAKVDEEEQRALSCVVRMAWRQAISKNLREVRIHLCQTSKSSQGVR